MTTRLKANDDYYKMMLFVMDLKVLPCDYVKEILACKYDHSNN